jgi:hypothetical protein
MRFNWLAAIVAALAMSCCPMWAAGINVTFEGGVGDVTNIATWGISASPGPPTPDWVCVVSDNSATTSACPGDGATTGPYAGVNNTPGGHWSLRLGTPNDGIYPTDVLTLAVPTSIGAFYDVSYWIRFADPTVTAPSQPIGVQSAFISTTFGGVSVLNNPILINQPFLQEWKIGILATSPTTNLVFSGLASLEGDFYIDDIVVQDSVPEPSTIMLMSLPLAALFALRRRK